MQIYKNKFSILLLAITAHACSSQQEFSEISSLSSDYALVTKSYVIKPDPELMNATRFLQSNASTSTKRLCVGKIEHIDGSTAIAVWVGELKQEYKLDAEDFDGTLFKGYECQNPGRVKITDVIQFDSQMLEGGFGFDSYKYKHKQQGINYSFSHLPLVPKGIDYYSEDIHNNVFGGITGALKEGDVWGHQTYSLSLCTDIQYLVNNFESRPIGYYWGLTWKKFEERCDLKIEENKVSLIIK